MAEIPEFYTVDELVDLSKSGYEGVLGAYLGPAAWTAGIITWLIILAMGLALGYQTKNWKAGGTFIGVGWVLAGFYWWLLYYMILASLLWPHVVGFIVLVVVVANWGSWASVPVSLLLVIIAFTWWLFPYLFVDLIFF